MGRPEVRVHTHLLPLVEVGEAVSLIRDEKMEDLKEEIVEVYAQTDAAVESLVENLKGKNVQDVEDAAHAAGEILDGVDAKKQEFRKRIAELEEDSEFEKFSIAFFGQTNAGKSTIIEALRVLFDEEGRKRRIRDNIVDRQKRREERVARCTEVIDRLEELRKAYRPTPILRKLAVSAILFAIGMAAGAFLVWRFL